MTFDKLTSVLSQGGHHLGDLIWWTLAERPRRLDHHRFTELRATYTPDVRRAMMKTLDACAAVTFRDHGGVYWVPAPYAELIRRLQMAIEKIGSSRVYLLPVHASADASRTLGDAAKLANRGRARAAHRPPVDARAPMPSRH